MKQNLGFIGAGNMSCAMISGIVQSNIISPSNIFVYDINQHLYIELAKNYNLNPCDNLTEMLAKINILILAVKPNVLPVVLKEINPFLSKDMLIISIAAGFPIDNIENIISKNYKIIRAMPNINALVQASMTSLSINSNVKNSDIDIALEIFSCFGKCKLIPESLIDAVIGVAGSSPAYVFVFIEALADAAVLSGMSRQDAYDFASYAVFGAAKSIIESNKHPAVLKDMVCSPSGTSIEALRVLEKSNFRSSIIEASLAATSKSIELSKKNHKV